MTNSSRERRMSIYFNGTEQEFLKCNKTILVDYKSQIEATFEKLTAKIRSVKFDHDITLNLANDRILEQSPGLEIPPEKWDNGLIARRTSNLLSSGIYEHLRGIPRSSSKRYFVKKTLRSRKPRPLNLNSNIVTLFAIYSVCIGIAIVCIVTEYFISPKDYTTLIYEIVFSPMPLKQK